MDICSALWLFMSNATINIHKFLQGRNVLISPGYTPWNGNACGVVSKKLTIAQSRVTKVFYLRVLSF